MFLLVFTLLHLIEQFWRLNGRNVRRVRSRNTYSIACKFKYKFTFKFSWNIFPICLWKLFFRNLLFRCLWTPSRHSGDNSLSPKDPSNSETKISAFSGATHSLISEDTTVTLSIHISFWSACSLQRSKINTLFWIPDLTQSNCKKRKF